ncbi:MAG TPA: orotidine-5'-phosphate decarboxylase [Candidatus Paceibacterota bacterium]|nr:orotidine-5'-phosphate decarboxylase [Candidatus Paceibacterota bacterium]
MIDTQKIIVALDGIDKEKALKVAHTLQGEVWGFKVNDLIFEDLEIISALKRFGKVFADVKLHDIPNTVENSVRRLSKKGADIITVHASGGVEMMKAAKRAANTNKSKIIAVTVLTSLSAENTKGRVEELAKEAAEAGIDGIVCSGQELEAIQNISEMRNMLKIVPGIRPSWYQVSDDQVRTTTPQKALGLGADLLVIGRPMIVQVNDPRIALEKICRE